MKVHLRKRKMRLKKGTSKPRYSLYLDIYYRKGKRKREFLGIYLEPHDDKTVGHHFVLPRLGLFCHLVVTEDLSHSLYMEIYYLIGKRDM